MKHQIKILLNKGPGSVRFRPMCPSPTLKCSQSKKGRCCAECPDRKLCLERCLNDPEKCGLWDDPYR